MLRLFDKNHITGRFACGVCDRLIVLGLSNIEVLVRESSGLCFSHTVVDKVEAHDARCPDLAKGVACQARKIAFMHMNLLVNSFAKVVYLFANDLRGEQN